MSGQWNSIVAVWVLAVVGAVLTGALASPGHVLSGFGLTLAGSILIALCLQLATGRKEGYVLRVTASIVGAVIVLGAASIVFAVLQLG
ncbi:hypothetical protein JF66_06995 [Cryobacterium sp. MLB-32]|uniref:hypothetical protein n=1 Tax=Cryobacterium sp. MLB-32 TaxID=1529318 RepID=UPI0004E7442B|nr:hypothetical protein [Cryobacterium sp. MLB-32]KFF60056.1 hypothetical protein JF66_06995 [Cryobacterium sp. MLB-32]